MQLIDAIPEKWKVIVRNHPNNSKGLVSKYSLYWQTESELCIIDISCKSMYGKLLKRFKPNLHPLNTGKKSLVAI